MSETKMPKIYMSFRNNQKAIEVPNGLRTVIRKCIAETLRVTDFVGDADVSVTLVDNERIKRINKEFRDKNKVTDVISFPLGAYDEYDINPENGAYMLGDIVISMEKAHAQAIEYGHSLIREVGFGCRLVLYMCCRQKQNKAVIMKIHWKKYLRIKSHISQRRTDFSWHSF